MSKDENSNELPSDSEDYDYYPTETSEDEETVESEDEETVEPEDEETVEVNGFEVLPSQENLVREMFKNHPDLTSNFDLKNQQLKNCYMDVLLDLMETLWQSTKNLSREVLNEAETTLLDLTRAGFRVGWLREELNEAYLKKEKQRVSESRIRKLEELVQKRKLNLSNLEYDLEKEKAEFVLAIWCE